MKLVDICQLACASAFSSTFGRGAEKSIERLLAVFYFNFQIVPLRTGLNI